jgi:hypothetical protein
MAAFFKALGTALYERVWLSYRSTILGILVAALGEVLNYFVLAVPDPKIHALCVLLTTIFVAWKDKKVKDGAIKLLAILCFVSFGSYAQGSPVIRRALQEAVAADANSPEPAPALPSVAAPAFGGCVSKGHLCFGPTIALTVAAINLSKGTIEGAFKPGLGYGMTLNPGKWSSIGFDVYFDLDPAAQKAGATGMLKLFNEYLRVGISKGFIGEHDVRIPVAFGINL